MAHYGHIVPPRSSFWTSPPVSSWKKNPRFFRPAGSSVSRSRKAFDICHGRCTFTGKERDEETGYGHFGARYMDHELMTGWLSVDPMADKYPGISPYAYCAWNPVRLVDPDGEEVVVAGGAEEIAKFLGKLKYEHISVTWDSETSKLGVDISSPRTELSDDENMIIQAIEDQNIKVQIVAFTACKDKNGKDCFVDPIDKKTLYETEGGSFYEGRLIKDQVTSSTKARTTSFVDVDLLDRNGYSNGVPHEISEGYVVGRLMLETNTPFVDKAIQCGTNPIVKDAHKKAIREIL